MKLLFAFFFAGLLGVSASTYSQQTKISINLTGVSVKEAFKQIEKKSEFVFFYNEDNINVDREVNVNAKDEKIETILNELLEGTKNTYKIYDRQIVILAPEVEVAPSAIKPIAKAEQSKKISGSVSDNKGVPLPDVNVIVKGTVIGTLTDSDGKFQLSVPADAKILVFSFIGMNKKEVALTGLTIFNIVLEENLSSIDEIVTIGYATQAKSDVTSSISTISEKEFNDRTITNVSQALDGLVPGMTIIQNFGAPGASPANINIRGLGALNREDSNPYVIVDGAPTYIENVNPSDIATMTVLKDAAATAIYGSAGANGVILITTKGTGTKKSERVRVVVNSSVGTQIPINIPEYVGAIDYMKMVSMYERNNLVTTPTFTPDYITNYSKKIGSSDLYPDTKWYDAVLKDNLVHSEDVSVSGGSDKASVSLSVSNLDNPGIIANTYFNRKGIRLTTSFAPNKYWRFNATYGDNITKKIEPSYGTNNVFSGVAGMAPVQNAFLSNGLYGKGNNGTNPVAYNISGGTNTDKREQKSIDMGVALTPLKGLKVSFDYSYRSNYVNIDSFSDQYLWYNNDGTPGGKLPTTSALSVTAIHAWANQYRGLITYSNIFAKKHSLSVVAGFDNYDNHSVSLNGKRSNFLLTNYQQLNAGDVATATNSGSADINTVVSWIGRSSYSYDSRYLLEVVGRYDQTSIFAPENRGSFFPAFSAGWNLNKESFMKGIKEINMLKLRGSWGQAGRATGGFYPYQASVDLTQSIIMNEKILRGSAVTTWADNTIRWETATTTNFGLDFGFLNNRLSGSFDYYVKTIADGVATKPVPVTSGLKPGYSNFIGMENKGWELTLNWRDQIKDFSYSIRFNLSDVRNKITDLGGLAPVLGSYQIGYELGSYFMYKTDGLLTQQDILDPNVPKISNKAVAGNVKLLDISGPDGVPDGKISATYDRYNTGTVFPRYSFSFPITLGWKGFDANIVFQGVGLSTRYINRYTASGTANAGAFLTWERDAYDLVDNPNGKIPALGGDNGGLSDFWLKSSAYLRLKTAIIGYTLPLKLTQKYGLSKVRFYFSGENLLTFSNYWEGFDPQARGSAITTYPNVANYTFGLNLNF